MKKKLYIIGNGFDQWHGLNTSYKCFNCFMHREHKDMQEKIGHIFNRLNANMLWSDYENMLSQLEVIELVKNNIDHWIDCGLTHEIENIFNTLHQYLVEYFHDWALQIDFSVANQKRLAIDTDSLFFNFNYTNTLEKFYGIYRGKICYIHGDTSNNDLLCPAVGHGDTFIENKVRSLKDEINKLVLEHDKFNTQNINTEEIIDIIKEFLKGLRKDTDYYLKENDIFFYKLNNIEEIYVLGHSLSKVDALYFTKIHSVAPNATWYVSYFGEKERCDRRQKLCELLEVSQDDVNIKLFTLDELVIKI